MPDAQTIGEGAALATAAASVYGTLSAADAAKQAGAVQAAAANKGADTQQTMFNTTLGNAQPFIDAGQKAVGTLSQFAGDPTQINSALAAYANSPTYTFARDQGQLAIDRSNAAKGGYLSGQQLKDASTYNTGVASGTLGQYVDMLKSIAGMGANSTATLGNIGANTGAGIANSQLQAGAGDAAGIVGDANAINKGIGNTITSSLQARALADPASYRNNQPNQPNQPGTTLPTGQPAPAPANATLGGYTVAPQAPIGYQSDIPTYQFGANPNGPALADGGAVGTLSRYRFADGGQVPAGTLQGFVPGASGGRADAVAATLPEGAYVLPSDVVSAAGEGNSAAGAKALMHLFHRVSGGPAPVHRADGGPVLSGYVPIPGTGDPNYGGTLAGYAAPANQNGAAGTPGTPSGGTLASTLGLNTYGGVGSTLGTLSGIPGGSLIGNGIGTGLDLYNENQSLGKSGLPQLGFSDWLGSVASNTFPGALYNMAVGPADQVRGIEKRGNDIRDNEKEVTSLSQPNPTGYDSNAGFGGYAPDPGAAAAAGANGDWAAAGGFADTNAQGFDSSSWARGGAVTTLDKVGAVPGKVSSGELVLPRHIVLAAGKGDEAAGRKKLDQFVLAVRKANIQRLKKLPAPAKAA